MFTHYLPFVFIALDDMKNYLENPDSMIEMKFLLLEQKYLELVSNKSTIDALKVKFNLLLQCSYFATFSICFTGTSV